MPETGVKIRSNIEIKRIQRRITNKIELIFSIAGIDGPVKSRNILLCQKAINQTIASMSEVRHDTITFSIFHLASTIIARNPGDLTPVQNTRLVVGVLVFAFIELEMSIIRETDQDLFGETTDALLEVNDEGVTQEFAIATRISKYYTKMFERSRHEEKMNTSDLVKIFRILQKSIPEIIELLTLQYRSKR